MGFSKEENFHEFYKLISIYEHFTFEIVTENKYFGLLMNFSSSKSWNRLICKMFPPQNNPLPMQLANWLSTKVQVKVYKNITA